MSKANLTLRGGIEMSQMPARLAAVKNMKFDIPYQDVNAPLHFLTGSTGIKLVGKGE